MERSGSGRVYTGRRTSRERGGNHGREESGLKHGKYRSK
jgi:hypothetical protein